MRRLCDGDAKFNVEDDPGETSDPDLVDEALSPLVMFYSVGTLEPSGAEVYWRIAVELDVTQRIKWRRKQKMILARYARQSLLQWDDVEANEIDWLVDDLLEILKSEGLLSDDRASG